MKKIANVLVIILMLTAVVAAGDKTRKYNPEILEKAEKNSLETMDSGFDSLVESAIFNMILFKAYVPNWEFDQILEKLNELSIEGKTASIRYKAQLASLFITYPGLFADIESKGSKNPAELFKVIANRIETNFYAVN